MNWTAFFQSLGKFFSGIGQAFLSYVMAAIPQVEQAAVNFLQALVQTIISDIESGVIPLPVSPLAAEPGTTPVDPLAIGKIKRDAAFAAVKTKLATMTVPEDVSPYLSDSLIYWTIETGVRQYKTNNSGNHGVFPGGNSGPVPESKK